MNVLVGVIVYNRKYTINQWLRAWTNANKYGSKLLVVHNHDGAAPDAAERENIVKWKPDYYLSRPNVGQDIGALQDIIKSTAYDPWDVLCWFVDDNLPMRKDFLKPFIKPFERDPRIGLVGNYWVPNGFWEGYIPDHFRTTAFALRRDIAMYLRFPNPLLTKKDCYHFEWAGDSLNMTSQIRRMGYLAVPACGNLKRPWTDCNEYVWDTESLGPRCRDRRCRHDLWSVFEKQFRPKSTTERADQPSVKPHDRRSFKIPKA